VRPGLFVWRTQGPAIDDADAAENRQLARRGELKFDQNCTPPGVPAPAVSKERGFNESGTGTVFKAPIASNRREKAKRRECAAIMIVFRQNPDVV
jgi:hypothetical protein